MWWSEQKGKSLRAAAKRFGVSRSSISDWKQAILHGKNLYTPGRPRALDNEALAQVEKEAMNAYLHNNTTPAGKFGIDGQSTIHDMILEGAKETSERRGQVFNRIGIDPKTEKRVIDLANLKSAATEETTGYRARATTSIYMATSTVILFYCVSILKILPALLINLDCTRCDVTLNSVATSTKGVVPRGSVGKNKKSSAKTSAKTTKI